MAIYFAVSEGYYEVVKVLVQAHTQQGVGLDLVVKVNTPTTYIHFWHYISPCRLHLAKWFKPIWINSVLIIIYMIFIAHMIVRNRTQSTGKVNTPITNIHF